MTQTQAPDLLLPGGDSAPDKRPERDNLRWSDGEVTLALEFKRKMRWTDDQIAVGLARSVGAVAELFKDLAGGGREYPADCTWRLPVVHFPRADRRPAGEAESGLLAQVNALDQRLERLRKLFVLIEQYGRLQVAAAIAAGDLSTLDLPAVGMLPDEAIHICHLAQRMGHARRNREMAEQAVCGLTPPPPLVVTGQGDFAQGHGG